MPCQKPDDVDLEAPRPESERVLALRDALTTKTRHGSPKHPRGFPNSNLPSPANTHCKRRLGQDAVSSGWLAIAPKKTGVTNSSALCYGFSFNALKLGGF